MWCWYLLGYVVTGLIAIVGSVAWIVIVTPFRNGYDLDHWLAHFTEARLEVQCVDFGIRYLTSKDRLIGIVTSMLAWPVYIVWNIRELYPRIIKRYEDMLIR